MCTFDLLGGEVQLKVGNSDCTICFQPTLPNYCKTLPKTFTVSLVLNVVLGKAEEVSVKYADSQVLLNSLEWLSIQIWTEQWVGLGCLIHPQHHLRNVCGLYFKRLFLKTHISVLWILKHLTFGLFGWKRGISRFQYYQAVTMLSMRGVKKLPHLKKSLQKREQMSMLISRLKNRLMHGL